MAALIKNPQALLLKFQLEAAIQKYQAGLPFYPDFDFISEDFDDQFEANLEQARQTQYNGQLMQYFAYGIRLRKITLKEPTNTAQRIGVFLYDYFEGIEGAIGHIQGIAPFLIDRVKRKELQDIINQRPPISLGQTKESKEEVWYTGINLVDSPLPYSPKPYTPSDHPQTPPQESAPALTPEPQQAGQKRSRTSDSEDDFDLEAWLRSDPEVTRDLEFLEETHLTKRIRAADF